MEARNSFCNFLVLLLTSAAAASSYAEPFASVATYQIVIPADGLAEDARYDFVLDAGETVQIVDRTPGFQATIEPTSFSTEGFAYENPDCDLTRRLRYRTAFSQAKPSHIFWRRDVKRDMIDGRKYTFINPTEEELDTSNSVEFCIVVTAPSPVPEPADPDVVFRRRLQEIPEPDEHTLTIVIHSAASCLGPSFPLLTALVMAFVLGNMLI